MEKSKNFPVLREEKVSRKNPPIIDASRWMVIPDRDQEKWFLKLSLLGRGGFSEVYKVQSMEDNEVYALKAVSYTHEGEGLLANEIKILQKLKGLPWIVELKDFFLDKASQMCYILLELGTLDLSQVIKGILKEEDLNSHRINCRKLWLDMVMAVKTIHDNNIVHSDLKPANFLMVGAHLKLIDFGISTKLQDDSTSVLKDTRCGTFNYMAPEMLQTTSTNGEVYKVGRYSDVWSMGCILYLMLYGHTPFQHISLPMQKFLAIVNPDHVIEYPSHPNKQAVHVIELCLQRNPKLRPTVENLLHHPFISGDMLQ
jgi:serine/threonine-protein kinase TTK/MPS1